MPFKLLFKCLIKIPRLRFNYCVDTERFRNFEVTYAPFPNAKHFAAVIDESSHDCVQYCSRKLSYVGLFSYHRQSNWKAMIH